jgi:hypothetical protein
MLERKLAALEDIYGIYNEFIHTREIVCQKGCSHCCTAAVTLTTLEGYRMIHKLVETGDPDLMNRLKTAGSADRYRPQTTTNQLAALCARGEDPPQAELAAAAARCFIITADQCPLYDLRPFGCRCLVSRRNCGANGYAEMDDFVLSVNTVFLQTIEHLDCPGCTGNLVDILQTLSLEENRKAYSQNTLHCPGNALIPNHPLKVLMLPPEHRQNMEPILAKLRQIKL